MSIINFNSFLIQLKLIIRSLYLAVSSIEFYQDVRDRYSGYGIRYIITISFMGAIFYLLSIASTINDINNYFIKGNYKDNQVSRTMAMIFSQWPEIYYQNEQILMEQSSPYVITNYDNRKLITIDSNNTGNTHNLNSYIIMTKYYIQIKLDQQNSNMKHTIPYREILGDQSIKIDKHLLYTLIQNQLKEKLNLSSIIVSVIISLPIITLYLFVLLALKSALVSIFVLLLLSFSMLQSRCSMTAIIRLAVFCSAPAILASIIIGIFNTSYLWLSFVVQMWSWILVICSFNKLSSQNDF